MIHSFAFIYICQQIEKTESATIGVVMCSGLNLSSGGELKLYFSCTGSTREGPGMCLGSGALSDSPAAVGDGDCAICHASCGRLSMG